MGKKKNKSKFSQQDAAKVRNKNKFMYECTMNRNKHGRLKGKNKKHTKALIASCCHFRYNKSLTKQIATIDNHGDGTCTCYMCGDTFPTTAEEKKTVKKMTKDIRAIVSQAKFMVVNGDLGMDGLKFLVDLYSKLQQFPKLYGRILKMALKDESVREKKKSHKKGHGNNRGSEFGAWGWR